jgi:predicted RNase H-like HicB family nuclease
VLQQRADDRGSEAQHAEAIQQHVATLLAQGEPVPQNERLVHVEELSIGLP